MDSGRDRCVLLCSGSKCVSRWWEAGEWREADLNICFWSVQMKNTDISCVHCPIAPVYSCQPKHGANSLLTRTLCHHVGVTITLIICLHVGFLGSCMGDSTRSSHRKQVEEANCAQAQSWALTPLTNTSWTKSHINAQRHMWAGRKSGDVIPRYSRSERWRNRR